MSTTIRLSGGDLGGESMMVRCNLSNASSPIEVDYCEGAGWQPTQYQASHTSHRTEGLIEIGKELAAAAVEMPVDEFDCDSTNMEIVTNNQFKNKDEVRAWIESVDETNTQQEDIADEIADAWQIVYGHPLTEEDDDMQRDAWSHLCNAVL